MSSSEVCDCGGVGVASVNPSLKLITASTYAAIARPRTFVHWTASRLRKMTIAMQVANA